MIIDRVPIAGPDAYFQRAGSFNLAGAGTFVGRTRKLEPGQQREISGIRLFLRAADLTPLFERQTNPLLRIAAVKELFPGLFADPYSHRAHTIGGFDDFNRGKSENCQPMELDGIPTLVSTGSGPCKWTSPVYSMPAPVTLDAVAWDLAASRLTPAAAFRHSLRLWYWDAQQTPADPPQELPITVDASAQAVRAVSPLTLARVAHYQVEFAADVLDDSYVYERHTPLRDKSIGRPLLRAVNLLEQVPSEFAVHSLAELLTLSISYDLFEQETGPLTRLAATLSLSATLVNSPNQDEPSDRFEHVRLEVDGDRFAVVEARLEGSDLVRPPRDV